MAHIDIGQQRRALAIVGEALDLPPSDRVQFVASACGDEAELRDEVESMLDAGGDDSRGLSHGAVCPEIEDRSAGSSILFGSNFGDGKAPISLPERIGRYRITGFLGAGGMGVVYRAEQENPRREVALKTLRLGVSSPRILSRFKAESALLARLAHPGIAHVYEYGIAATPWGEQPFIAMELVEGPSLLTYVKTEQPTLREKLVLFASLCDAVQFAHQRAVIHRDLKPSNILVAAGPQPKILDFGVARLLDDNSESESPITIPGELIGTLAYMSPEQLAGSPDGIDTRTDVYALGIVLYEVLSGRLPYQLRNATLPQAARMLHERAPRRISEWNRELRGDLETIVTKALSKERDQRYASAGDLADDVRRFLSNEPIRARPPHLHYVLRKLVRRHRAYFAAGVGVILALIGGLTAMVYGLSRAAFESNQRAEILESAVRTVSHVASETLPKLNTLIGSGDVRGELLAEFERLNDDLRRIGGTDESILTARAALLESLSELARVEARFDDALKQRREALEIRHRLYLGRPDDIERGRKYATGLILVGDVFGEQGDADRAERWYRDARDIQETLSQGRNDVGLLIDLVWSQVRLGHCARGRPDTNAARAHLDQAIRLLGLLELQGGDRVTQLYAEQEVLGQMALLEDNPLTPHSRELMRRRLQCLLELTIRKPGDRLTVSRLRRVAYGIALGALEDDDCATARSTIESAIAAAAPEWQADPDPGWVIAALSMESALAEIEWHEGHRCDAMSRLQRIVDQLNDMPNTLTGCDDLVQLRWEITRRFVTIASQVGQVELARRVFEETIEVFSVIADGSGDQECVSSRLAALLYEPPAALQPDLPRALDYFKRARPSAIWPQARISKLCTEIQKKLTEARSN